MIGEKGYHEEAENFRLMLRRKMEELDDTFEKSSWYRDYWTDGKRNIMKGAKG